MVRCYSELVQLPTFEERYRYLRIGSKVGDVTFGCDRWLNQRFYREDEDWLAVRSQVIIRDCGCDLGMEDRPIPNGVAILIHHMNPISKEDILRRSKFLLDPEYLICTIKNTHDAIHYGDESILLTVPPERRKNDTCPWRH